MGSNRGESRNVDSIPLYSFNILSELRMSCHSMTMSGNQCAHGTKKNVFKMSHKRLTQHYASDYLSKQS